MGNLTLENLTAISGSCKKKMGECWGGKGREAHPDQEDWLLKHVVRAGRWHTKGC